LASADVYAKAFFFKRGVEENKIVKRERERERERERGDEHGIKDGRERWEVVWGV
jgi:hypothetical protein